MPCPLPERPSLEQLRKRARELQRGVRRGEDDALRIADTTADPQYPLGAAQRALARFYGFASWPRLRQHVAAIESLTWSWQRPDADEPPGHRFLRSATVSYEAGAQYDLDVARALLGTEPGLPTTDLAVAAVCGDADAVRRHLADGGPADAAAGPFGWPALMYLAYGRLDVGETATLATARALLAAGADPNSGRYFLGYPTPFTVLTGTFGDGEAGQPAHPHAIALAHVLLDAGAEPNDGQTLYNRMFGDNDDFLHVLFAHGLGQGEGGPWRQRLPDLADSPTDMLRGLRDWAVLHGQRDRLHLLAEHDVDLLAPGNDDAQPPIVTALANAHHDVADVLRAAGAGEPTLTAAQACAGALLGADRMALDAVTTANPAVLDDLRRRRPGLIVWAAAQGRPAAVELLAEVGFAPDALARGDVPREQPWQTALHSAVEHDHGEVVALLVRLGARRDIRDARFDGTAADWARHVGHTHLLPMLED